MAHQTTLKKGVNYPGLGVGAFIVNDKGEILMGLRGPDARNEPGHWNIPGGGVELGELRSATVLREVQEEVGLRVEIIAELLANDHHIPADPANNKPAQHWVTTPFVVRIAPGQTPKVMEPTTFSEIGWFHIDNLPEPLVISMAPGLRAYRDYLAQKPPKY